MTSQQQARTMVTAAIKRGDLVPASCSRCGNPKAEAHHEDYSRPLDVVWLCRKCHAMRHAELIPADSIVTGVRTTVTLRADMVWAIDQYQHQQRLLSRNEAIRELLAYALDAKRAKPAKEQRR